MSGDCVFCARIAAKEYDRTTDPAVVSFVPLNPVTPGHRLFVPRDHLMYADTNPDFTGRTFAAAADWGGGWIEPGYNLIQSNGRAATQSVFHLHVHYVPRVDGDGLLLPWSVGGSDTPADQPEQDVQR